MALLTLILGVLGGICTVLGILTALGILPGFTIASSELIGPAWTATMFLWGLAAILLLGCIAAAVYRSHSKHE